MTYIKHWSKCVAAAAIVLAGFGLQACGDDDDDSVITPGDDGGAVDSGSDEAGKGGDKGGTGGKGGTKDGGKEDAGSSGKGGSDSKPDAATDSGSGDCTGDDDCYSCEPKTVEQFLNHCTDATCQGYDNKTLTKLGDDGELPELPE